MQKLYTNGEVIFSFRPLSEKSLRIPYVLCLLLILSGNMFSQDYSMKKIVDENGFSNKYFGHAVSIDGDRMAVSAFDYNLSFTNLVLIYEKNNEGKWEVVAEIKPNEQFFSYHNFGCSLSLHGDKLAVGSFTAGDYDEGTANGAVYVYERNSIGNWTNEYKIYCPVQSDFGIVEFGISVDLTDDYLAIGSSAIIGEGVFIYEPAGAGWAFSQQLKSSNFVGGYGLELSKDVLACYVPSYSASDFEVFLFRSDENNYWSEETILSGFKGPYLDGNSNSINDVYYGTRISLVDNELVVGSSSEEDHGVVYCYAREESGSWSIKQEIRPENPTQNMIFGKEVGLSNDYLAIVTQETNTFGNACSYLHIYSKDETGRWIQDERIELLSDGVGVLANDISLSNNQILIGDLSDQDLGLFSGAIYYIEIDTPEPEEEENRILFQAIPNPFSGSTSIFVDLQKSTVVDVRIFDLNGKQIRQINKECNSGINDILIDLSGLTGTYIYTLTSDEFLVSGKLIAQ